MWLTGPHSKEKLQIHNSVCKLHTTQGKPVKINIQKQLFTTTLDMLFLKKACLPQMPASLSKWSMCLDPFIVT